MPNPYEDLFQAWKGKVEKKQSLKQYFEDKPAYFLRVDGVEFSFPERLNHFLPTLHLQMKFKHKLLKFVERNDLKDPVVTVWIRRTSSIADAYDAIVCSYYIRDLWNIQYLLLRLNWDSNYFNPFGSWYSFLISNSSISTRDLTTSILTYDFYNYLIKHQKIDELVNKIATQDQIPVPIPLLGNSTRELLMEKFEDPDFNYDDFFQTLFDLMLIEKCAPSKMVTHFLQHLWYSVPLDENMLAKLLNVSLSVAIRILENKDKDLLHSFKLKTPKWESFKASFTNREKLIEFLIGG